MVYAVIALLLALGAVGVLMLTAKTASLGPPPDVAPTGAPSPLWAGVRYLFVVRLEVTEEMARAILEAKGVEALEFSSATVAPFWAKPGVPYSDRVAAFRFLAKGNGSVTPGSNFYEVGRLERVVRLDGQEFSAPAPDGGSEGWV